MPLCLSSYEIHSLGRKWRRRLVAEHVGTSSTSRPHASATSTGSERRWRSPRPNASDCYARTHAHTCTQACIHANALTGACAHAACSTPGARDTHGRPTSSRLDSDAFDFAGFIGATGVGPILASTSCKFKVPAKSVTHSAVLGTDSSKQHVRAPCKHQALQLCAR